jgi:metallophosphoesterase (TIGR03768 family)
MPAYSFPNRFQSLVLVSLLLLPLAGCANVTDGGRSSTQAAGYPIDSDAATTLERTVIPVAVPSTSPKLLPNDVPAFSPNGYGLWKFGAGLPAQKRLDIMAPSYTGASVTRSASLLRFFTMSDIHITDIQSPAQTICFGLDGQPGMSSAYSPIIPYTTHVLDAAVQTVNALHAKRPFDCGIFLGDAINNTQFNELRWYIDTIDGRDVTPNSNRQSVAAADYLRPFKASGLDKSIPWYQVLGNHDHFWSGVYPPTERIRKTLVGEYVLNVGNVVKDRANIDGHGFYTGVVDGSTAYGKVIDGGPEAALGTPPKINANPDRRSVARNEWIAEFFKTQSKPAGHGFERDSATTGFACYSFEPKANLPLKVIVLDDTEKDDGVFGKNATGASGCLDPKRYDWLVGELDRGQAEGKLMIVAAHVPIGIGSYMWDPASSPTESTLIAKLHTYPNLIMWISGHRHYNAVTALPSPDPVKHPELGFWVVETASLRDFPQQFRLFDIYRNSDNNISIAVTNVDPAVKQGSPAAQSRSYGVAASEIFPGDPGAPYLPAGAYNADLVKHLSGPMQVKIQNCQAAGK